jgi:hypothetical protein
MTYTFKLNDDLDSILLLDASGTTLEQLSILKKPDDNELRTFLNPIKLSDSITLGRVYLEQYKFDAYLTEIDDEQVKAIKETLKNVAEQIKELSMTEDDRRDKLSELTNSPESFKNLLYIRYIIFKTAILASILFRILGELKSTTSKSNEKAIRDLTELLKDSSNVLLNIDNIHELIKPKNSSSQ